MKKWICNSFLRELNSFEGLELARVHRVETVTITYLKNGNTVKMRTVKNDEIMLVPNGKSNNMIFSRFFAIRDILKNLFNQKNI